MSHNSYPVGSAFAEALSQATALMRSPDRDCYRTVDFVNIGRHSSEMAHALMQSDPDEARRFLVYGASRMLAAAELLETATPQPNVIPFPRGERGLVLVVS